MGWWVNVCLSRVENGFPNPVAGPVTVTRPDGVIFEVAHAAGTGCSWYDQNDCDVLFDLRARPEHLGEWTVGVTLQNPAETLEHSFTVAAPGVPTVIRPMNQPSVLVTGAPGSRPRIAALLARAVCSRTGTPPDEVCEPIPYDDAPEWLTVLQTEIVGPVIGADGTVWFDPPAINWPAVPDPEPGLPYGGGVTAVCYAVIHSGTIADGIAIDRADCLRT